MSRPKHRLVAVVGVLAVLMGAAVGCGDDRQERAVTVDPKDTSNEADKVEDTDPDPELPGDAAGGQLSETQISDALLAVSDLPAGWTTSPNEDDDDSEDEISPAKCEEVLEALDDDSNDAAAKGDVNFNKGGPFGSVLSETISSYEDAVDVDVVQDIADAFSECPRFTSTDSEGEVSNVTISPMSFANLGDQTLAVAMTFESSTFTVAMNVAYVVVGHNVVAMFNGGIAGADGAELEKLTRQAIEKLERTAS